MTKYRKEITKLIMLKHLEEKGYPNMTGEEIMYEVPAIFATLTFHGLIPHGMTYNHFYTIALNKYSEAHGSNP